MPEPASKRQKLDKSSGPTSILKKGKKYTPSLSKQEVSSSSENDDDDEKQLPQGSASESTGASDAEDEYDLNGDDDNSEADSDSDDLEDLMSAQRQTKKRKRNDPEAFSTSMAKILSSHLTTTARKDPILVRSKKAAQHIDESRLEAKARRMLALEHKAALEKGRIKNVIPQGDADGEQVKAVMEKEKALRKLAQRGVIKLFNAVRAAQVTGARALQDTKSKGMIGMEAREKTVTEMSKQGFLDLIKTNSKAKA